MQKIRQFSFDQVGIQKLKETSFGNNWPVVYILNNPRQAYIGESSNVSHRIRSHLANKEREILEELYVIYDATYNKSAILDIEALLIQYMSADQKFILQNRNAGQSQAHDYYQRKMYIDSFRSLWKQLIKRNLADHELDVIRNSDLFKFSPFKTLTNDQYEVSQSIAFDIASNMEKNKTYVVHGGAGTGKTVLAVYLMNLIHDYASQDHPMEDLEEGDETYALLSNLRNLDSFTIGFVVPMTSLRQTLKRVFKQTKGLSASMVIGPNEVTQKNYDLLIVDEAHRLKRRKALTGYANFDKTNALLGLGTEGTELDWIFCCSKKQILFYDEKQSVRPSDIPKETFEEQIRMRDHEEYYLTSQLRVLGGNQYIDYINRLFNGEKCKVIKKFQEYDFRIFTDVDEMIREIQNKNEIYGLCRVAAGFAWPWTTKGITPEEIKEKQLYDIDIQGHHYVWNTVAKDWINSEHANKEVGCIHTVQGYDLNYLGVIIGNDLSYDPVKKTLEVHPEHYYDRKGKQGASYEELKTYILQAYKTMLVRGIRGTYVYICDKNLQAYLMKECDSRYSGVQ